MEAESSCGNEPFALRVIGDSMEPEFEDGHIIIIDPEGVVENGSYVLATHDEEYIFRQLLIENEKYFLKPLNTTYPTLEIADVQHILGVITQRAGKRRSAHKHYV